ncbi:MAG: S8 family serine peptidase [Planctomycetes bacterium]|nr:S8 family serine peptidase [Planctomycetota bacterium]
MSSFAIKKHQLCGFILTAVTLLSVVTFGMKDAVGTNGVNAYAVHEKGITGDGVNIALLSVGNVRESHAAFERSYGSAVRLYDFGGEGLARSNHDTHLAGIIISAGSPTHPAQIGVSPGAKIHSGRISGRQVQTKYLQEALDELILKKNCRVIVTGIQISSENVVPDGTSYWTKIYDYYGETYDVLFANAAGNFTPYTTIFGDSYNGITTAGLCKDNENHYRQMGRASNSGPTLDGRNKPDVSAPTENLTVPASSGDDLWAAADPNGLGLTSFAVPYTAGVAALLFEAAGKTPADDDDRTEVIKAVMVNSTFTDLVDKNGLAANSAGWNRDYGYGRLDALRAYETLTADRIVKDRSARQSKGWAYDTMPQNTEHIYRLAGRDGQQLVATVTWHRKLIKLSSTRYIKEPVTFELSLKIISPSGKTVVFETPDRNNLIKINHRLNEDGDYQIVLKNPTEADNRDYGLAFEIIDSQAKQD